MLSYEICKKLKEAGFPQKLFVVNGEKPSLLELIKECGDSFVYLRRDGENKWWARGNNGEYQTPEEAVANLYLKLKSNEKEKN